MLLLSGCASEPPKSTSPLPVPESLFKPCLIPEYQVQNYGDYPGYIAELFAVIEQCNYQLSAIEEIEGANG
ncbi:Rz1-like lysis system protein LysC [Limnobaculum xujianqingii]|uniref:Rz1-like lysis system protein LysC n=1 Tax=Limnobaculum xujianqingii TaxID=2738837 RepID=UPI0038D4601B